MEACGRGDEAGEEEEVEAPRKKSKKAPAKKAVSGEATWEYEDDSGSWLAFASDDMEMLEAKMEEVGVKGKFDTTAFSFNAVHQTLYTVNFSTMKQLNTESGKARKIRRSLGDEDEAPKPAAKKKAAAAPKAAPAAKKAKMEVPPPSPAKSPSKGGGGRKPDRSVPDGSSYAIHQDYDSKLMQTNIGSDNNNKFYIIQVLCKGGTYYTWNRWGRLGAEGQNKLENHGGNAADAIKSFQKKFKDKTKNNWSDRDSFVKYTGKYQLVEIDEGDDGSGGGDAVLGKLSEKQINKGQAVLAELRAALEGGGAKSNLIELSGSYYSYIPTKSGMKQPPPIADFEILQEKENLLEFWLRMGFEETASSTSNNPLAGLRERAIPLTLSEAASTITDTGSIVSSNTRGAELAKKKAGKPRKTMGPEKYASIVLYTGNSIYKALNQALRVQHHAVPKYFNYLRLFLEAMNCLPQQKTTLWRGIGVDLYDDYEEGSVVTWWSVSSCTSDKGVATNFMSSLGGGCTFLTLECKTAVDIAPLSIYSSEKESLLAPGTMLRVLSRERKGKVAHIHVEEIGNAIDS